MAASKPPKWSAIKQHLAQMDQAELIGLVKELFERSKENRAFLALRLLGDGGGEALEAYRKQVHEAAFPASIHKHAHIPTARKAIRAYQQTTGDLAGTIELMLTCLENGTAYTRQFGDISAPFYASLLGVLYDLVRLFETEAGQSLYWHHAERLDRLARAASGFGWGFSDEMLDQIGSLRAQMEDDLADAADT